MSEIALADLKEIKTKQVAAEFRAALDKIHTENPKPEDVKAFDKVVDQYPQMWHVMGDLAERAQRDIIDDMRVGPAMKASLRVGVKQMEKELSQPNDRELERIVIDQVILCWLRHYETEMYWHGAHSGDRINHTTSDFWDRKLTATQHRYLRAVESLARVRKLGRASVHVSIQQAAPAQLRTPFKMIDQY